MALLKLEGFEQYGDVADMRRGGWVLSTSEGSLVSGKDFGQAFNTNSTVANATWGIPEIQEGVLGCYFYLPTSIATGDFLRLTCLQGTEQLVLRFDGAGELAIDRGATQLAITSGLSLSTDAWHFLEFYWLISDTIGEYEVRIDESAKLIDRAGTADTQNVTSKSTVMEVWFEGRSNGCYWDHIYLCDTTGLTNNDFLGTNLVQTLAPDADGTTNNFTPLSGLDNYAMVDDGATPDDDTTYVSSATLNDSELYGFPAMNSASAVLGVQVTNHVRKVDAGVRTVRCIARNGLTTVEGDILGVGTDYRYVSHVFETDPDGGGAWDETAVNAAEFGITIEA